MWHGGRCGGRSFPACFLRSFLSAFLSALAVGAVLVVSLLHGATSVDVSRHRLGSAVPWKESWSQRYPGCVSVLLWPRDERPVAVVARRPDGTVTRVAVHGPSQQPAVLPKGAETVGACR